MPQSRLVSTGRLFVVALLASARSNATGPAGGAPDSLTVRPRARRIVSAALLLVAAIHAIPLVGVLSAARVSSLYGVVVDDANLEILLRHRAVLFGLFSVMTGYCALRPALHGIGLTAAAISVVSFIVIAQNVGGYNDALRTVVRVDVFAAVLVVIGAAVHLFSRPAVR